METSEITARLQSLQATAPAGLTGLDPMPYGYRRWNGAVWADIQVDRYNAELERIAARHRAGMDVQHLIDGLYNLAHGFDVAGKQAATNTLADHTGPDHQIVRHDARWSACPPCNRWIDTRGRD